MPSLMLDASHGYINAFHIAGWSCILMHNGLDDWSKDHHKFELEA
jgi:hypothetical protein